LSIGDFRLPIADWLSKMTGAKEIGNRQLAIGNGLIGNWQSEMTLWQRT